MEVEQASRVERVDASELRPLLCLEAHSALPNAIRWSEDDQLAIIAKADATVLDASLSATRPVHAPLHSVYQSLACVSVVPGTSRELFSSAASPPLAIISCSWSPVCAADLQCRLALVSSAHQVRVLVASPEYSGLHASADVSAALAQLYEQTNFQPLSQMPTLPTLSQAAPADRPKAPDSPPSPPRPAAVDSLLLRILCVEFAPVPVHSCLMLAVGGAGSEITLWSVAGDNDQLQLLGATVLPDHVWIVQMAFGTVTLLCEDAANDSLILAVATSDAQLFLLRVDSRGGLHRIAILKAVSKAPTATSMAWSQPSGTFSRLAVVFGSRLYIAEVDHRQNTRWFHCGHGHAGLVNSVVWASPDTLLTAASDEQVHMFVVAKRSHSVERVDLAAVEHGPLQMLVRSGASVLTASPDHICVAAVLRRAVVLVPLVEELPALPRYLSSAGAVAHVWPQSPCVPDASAHSAAHVAVHSYLLLQDGCLRATTAHTARAALCTARARLRRHRALALVRQLIARAPGDALGAPWHSRLASLQRLMAAAADDDEMNQLAVHAAAALDQVAPHDDEAHETCHVCGAQVPMTSLEADTCANGHRLERCSASFRLCGDEVKVRRCLVCNAAATESALHLSSRLHCPLCGVHLRKAWS